MKYKKCIKIVAAVIAVMVICLPALDCYAWSFDDLTGKGKEVADTSSDIFSQLDSELPDSFLKKVEGRTEPRNVFRGVIPAVMGRETPSKRFRTPKRYRERCQIPARCRTNGLAPYRYRIKKGKTPW